MFTGQLKAEDRLSGYGNSQQDLHKDRVALYPSLTYLLRGERPNFDVIHPQADLQALLLCVVRKGLVGKFLELEVGVVFQLAAVAMHDLLIVVSALPEQLRLVLGQAPEINLTQHLLEDGVEG